MKRQVFLFVMIMLFAIKNGMAEKQIIVNDTFKYLEIGKEIEYITTDKGQLTIFNFLQNNHPLFIQNKHDMLLLNENEYKEDLWIHLKINNSTATTKDLVLTINNSLINWIEFYEIKEGKIINQNIIGDALELNRRFIRDKNPVYPIKIKSNEITDVYFKFNLGGRKIHAPIELHSYSDFIENSLFKNINLGFFYGILTCLSFICFIIFYLLKDRVYFYLASYFTSQIFLQVAISGIGFVMIWPNNPFWNDRSIPFLMSFSIFLAIVFLIEFLKKNKINKYIFYIAVFFQIISGLIILASFTNGPIYNASIWVLYKILPVFYIGFFILSTYFFLTKYLPARFFFSAFLLALISIGAIYYYAITKTHNNVFTNQFVLVGEILKSILLMLALLDRLRIFKEEKEIAQMLVIQQLEQLNTLKENANKELMMKVEEKTSELSIKQNEVKKALIWGEEQERKRVAQELHDGLGSLLSTLRLNAESIDLKDKGLTEKELYAYQNVIELIDKACSELREISHNMMPPSIEQFGILQQLKSIIRNINISKKIEFTLDTFGLEERFNKDLELSIYRICLEFINNIIKHSKAQSAIIQLVRNQNVLSIIIEDDGIGFDSSLISEGIGFSSTRSRVEAFNGSMMIDTNKKRGTTVIIELPIENEN